LLRFKEVPFEDIRRGADPPDFLVVRNGSSHSVDCAVLSSREKRLAEALFTKLIQKSLVDDNTSLQHLAGTHVVMWFGSGSGLPPRATDLPAVQDLIEALKSAEIDRDKIARTKADLTAHGFPETLPKEGFGIFDKGSFGFQVDPDDNWQPRDLLSDRLGFDVSLHFSLMIKDVRTELQRLVSKHDNGRINQLLVITGSPNGDGVYFPAEQILGVLLQEEPIQPVSAQHISQVTAHNWISGEVFDLPVQQHRD
jgi:hypothetical protein